MLARTEKGEELLEDATDKLKDLTKKLSGLAGDTSSELASLTKKLSNGIEGLSDEAHEKIMAILKESDKIAAKGKRVMSNVM